MRLLVAMAAAWDKGRDGMDGLTIIGLSRSCFVLVWVLELGAAYHVWLASVYQGGKACVWTFLMACNRRCSCFFVTNSHHIAPQSAELHSETSPTCKMHAAMSVCGESRPPLSQGHWPWRRCCHYYSRTCPTHDLHISLKALDTTASAATTLHIYTLRTLRPWEQQPSYTTD